METNCNHTLGILQSPAAPTKPWPCSFGEMGNENMCFLLVLDAQQNFLGLARGTFFFNSSKYLKIL